LFPIDLTVISFSFVGSCNRKSIIDAQGQIPYSPALKKRVLISPASAGPHCAPTLSACEFPPQALPLSSPSWCGEYFGQNFHGQHRGQNRPDTYHIIHIQLADGKAMTVSTLCYERRKNI
jgi:hypothetical protein